MTRGREILVKRKYLNFPVQNGAPKRKVRFWLKGQVARVFEIELATGEPDFWVVADVSMFRGEKLEIRAESLPNVIQSDAIKGGENLYREKHRPQFHFSSRRGWHNDPNGLVYYEGLYHLFYQHNPYGWSWGNMHWGHAVSKNLVQWQELGVALYPDALGVMYSGSAVVDWDDTAGLKRGDEDALVCFYTAAGEWVEPPAPYTQCMAFSNDQGQTWQKYQGNPILPHVVAANRDPKVVWHQDTGQWIMALYLAKENEQQRFALYTSRDLKRWEHLQDVYLPGTGECPDFFPLALDGETEKWVFWAGDGRYVIGAFDGTAFVPETSILDRECANAYAAQTWSDVPPQDGRRIQIAWLRGDLPGMPFNQQMTFPVELTLKTTHAGPRLHFWPVREIEELYQEQLTLENVDLSQERRVLPTGGHDLLDVQATLEIGQATEVELNFRGIRLLYDAHSNKLFCGERAAPLKVPGGKLHLRVLLDRAALEIFAAHGLVYLPLGVIPDDDERACFIQARGGASKAQAITVFKLRSSWERR